jgi:hypothetical protein
MTAYDKSPLWSAMFGLLLLTKYPIGVRTGLILMHRSSARGAFQENVTAGVVAALARAGNRPS